MSSLPGHTAFQSSSNPVTVGSFQDFSEDILHNLFELHGTHGPIAALEDGTQRIVFLFDPALNQQVLSDTSTFEARFFALRGPKRSSQRRVTCGLLAMNGDRHRHNRRMLKEVFSLKTIAGYRDTIVHLIERHMAGWHAGQSIDINEEMTRLMLSITSTILFGLENFDEAYDLGERIADWVAKNHEVGAGALVPSDKFSKGYEDLLNTAEQLEASVLQMIDQHRSRGTSGNDILSILMANHGGEGGLTNEEFVGQTCVLFAAAHMTTAHSMTWMLTLLAQHPQIARQLCETGLSDQASSSSDEMPLMERIIKESMRVLPASAYSQRVASQAVQLGPLEISRGTPIVFTPLVTHRLEHLYKQPKSFDPDRWLTLRPGPYEYIPFGGGNRLCIGGPLALEIIRTAIPRFLSEYRFELEAGAKVDAEVQSTMLQPTHGVPATLHEADGRFTSVPLEGNLPELVDFPEPESLQNAPRKPR